MTMPASIYSQIRNIELYTRRLIQKGFFGGTLSTIKGLGFEFDQLREYQITDDIRTIDWNSSARMQQMLVKQYVEEHNRTIVIALDVSLSMRYGVDEKYQRVLWLASIMALIGMCRSDSVGLILYSDTIEKYIPPRKGLLHARSIMALLLGHIPTRTATNSTPVFEKILTLRGPILLCMFSDFIDISLGKTMQAVAQKHDLVAVRCLDNYERLLPSSGFIKMRDTETGKESFLDLSRRGSKTLQQILTSRLIEQETIFKKYNIHYFDTIDQTEFIKKLSILFRSQMR